MNLHGKVIALTGASGGIGHALAQSLAAAGAYLLLNGRKQAQLESQLAALPNSEKHRIVKADLATPMGQSDFIEAAIDAQVSGLIVCAGVNHQGLFSQQTPEQLAEMTSVNLTVPMQVTQRLLPHLQQQSSPFIVLVGSTLGAIGVPGMVGYCASKFGLRGFAQALRRELADTPTGILYLAPRATKTSMNDDIAVALNEALGNAMDSPERVARECVDCLQKKRWGEHFVGQPEGIFARLNGVLPGIVDGALKKQLAQVKRYLTMETKV